MLGRQDSTPMKPQNICWENWETLYPYFSSVTFNQKYLKKFLNFPKKGLLILKVEASRIPGRYIWSKLRFQIMLILAPEKSCNLGHFLPFSQQCWDIFWKTFHGLIGPTEGHNTAYQSIFSNKKQKRFSKNMGKWDPKWG